MSATASGEESASVGQKAGYDSGCTITVTRSEASVRLTEPDTTDEPLDTPALRLLATARAG